MELVPFTHPADATGPTYVGNKLVHPGQTIFIEGTAPVVVPDEEDQQPVLTGTQQLQKLSIAKIKDQLPGLDEADLQALLLAEKAAPSPRSTLIGEIEAEQLKRKAAA